MQATCVMLCCFLKVKQSQTNHCHDTSMTAYLLTKHMTLLLGYSHAVLLQRGGP